MTKIKSNENHKIAILIIFFFIKYLFCFILNHYLYMLNQNLNLLFGNNF